MVKIQKLIFKL